MSFKRYHIRFLLINVIWVSISARRPTPTQVIFCTSKNKNKRNKEISGSRCLDNVTRPQKCGKVVLRFGNEFMYEKPSKTKMNGAALKPWKLKKILNNKWSDWLNTRHVQAALPSVPSFYSNIVQKLFNHSLWFRQNSKFLSWLSNYMYSVILKLHFASLFSWSDRDKIFRCI